MEAHSSRVSTPDEAPGIRTYRMVDRSDRLDFEIRDHTGHVQRFSTLVLALGSRARIPDVPGVGQANVFAFRDLSDAHALMARQVSSRHTVVLGGGLLGIEAARAMQRLNTQVTIVEQGPHLMGRQLGNALLATGLTDVAREAMAGLGLDLDEIYEMEVEPGLGNGGLGRLAVGAVLEFGGEVGLHQKSG